MNINPWLSMEGHRSRLRQHQENTARLAQSFAEYSTSGWGETRIQTITEFNCTFIERPHVSYGYSVDGDTLVDTRFPRCWGGVYRWKTNPRGHYTGAWVFIVAETMSYQLNTDKEEPGYDLSHYFTFTGVAMKDLPEYLLDL